jgi:peptidoglycan/LPS O-acetylase OafA/YrhL
VRKNQCLRFPATGNNLIFGLNLLMQNPCLTDYIGKSDNLEVMRLLAAIGVVFGHSFALAMRGQSGVTEPVSILLPGTYSGSLAVEVFFFISGFLITHSLLAKSNILLFLRARAARVLPAFIVMALVTTFLLAPFASTLGFAQYLKNPATHQYFFSLMSLDLVPGKNIIWGVPGAFTEHNNTALNGSIWSLFYEIKLYLLSAVAIFLAAYRWPWLGSTLCFFALCYTLDQGALRSPNDYIMSAVFMYWLGSLVRFHSDQIIVGIFPLLLTMALVYYLRYSAAAHAVYALLVASAVIYLSYAEKIPKLKLPGDYSYGLFLWSFPIQQLLAWQWPSLGPYRFFVVSLLISFVFAIISWHFVEKPAVQWHKRRLQSKANAAT